MSDIVDNAAELRALRRENAKLRRVLAYYADPETYFAIGFWPDRPCGDFMRDFGRTHLGIKPGKRAREALGL